MEHPTLADKMMHSAKDMREYQQYKIARDMEIDARRQREEYLKKQGVTNPVDKMIKEGYIKP